VLPRAQVAVRAPPRHDCLFYEARPHQPRAWFRHDNRPMPCGYCSDKNHYTHRFNDEVIHQICAGAACGYDGSRIVPIYRAGFNCRSTSKVKSERHQDQREPGGDDSNLTSSRKSSQARSISHPLMGRP
jgi:hypothetical protein